MTEHEPAMSEDAHKIHEQPRIEEHRVYALLALPIFAVTIFIVVLIATLGTK